MADEARAHWHDQALWFVREKRDRAASLVPDWERLRDAAAAIRAHARPARRSPRGVRAERGARGAKVHWAADGEEHNAIVHRILAEHGVRRLVKSKSMLTEECGLNHFLEARGIEVVDTDLGERIVQLKGEPPSHIVFPAIHRKREEIGDLFHEKLGTPQGLADPKALTEAARVHLRERFMRAEAGLTGVNFAVAETGGVVVCTNEGNADMGTSSPAPHRLHGRREGGPAARAPRRDARLLARSATGSPSRPTPPTSTARCRGRAAHRHRGQRPLAPPRESGRARRARLHPLRRLHEHLPGVPAERRVQLRLGGPGADRLDPRERARSGGPRDAAVRLDAVRLVRRGLPREDRPPRQLLAWRAELSQGAPGGALRSTIVWRGHRLSSEP